MGWRLAASGVNHRESETCRSDSPDDMSFTALKTACPAASFPAASFSVLLPLVPSQLFIASSWPTEQPALGVPVATALQATRRAWAQTHAVRPVLHALSFMTVHAMPTLR